MSIEAMKQMIELYDKHSYNSDHGGIEFSKKHGYKFTEAVEALRTVIQQAEAQQPATTEPVAWNSIQIASWIGSQLMHEPKPTAYVVWEENGNCIMWTTNKAQAKECAKKHGRPMRELYDQDVVTGLLAAEEGAAEAFGVVVQDKRDLENEVSCLRTLLEGAHATIRTVIQQAETQQARAQVQGEAFGYIHHFSAHDESGALIDTTWEADGCADPLPHPTSPSMWKWTHCTPFYTTPHPLRTERELELIDGMIAVQLDHAQRCDAISNRDMAEKQKGWDMERVELLRRIRSFGITAHAQKGTNGEIS